MRSQVGRSAEVVEKVPISVNGLGQMVIEEPRSKLDPISTIAHMHVIISETSFYIEITHHAFNSYSRIEY